MADLFTPSQLSEFGLALPEGTEFGGTALP